MCTLRWLLLLLPFLSCAQNPFNDSHNPSENRLHPPSSSAYDPLDIGAQHRRHDEFNARAFSENPCKFPRHESVVFRQLCMRGNAVDPASVEQHVVCDLDRILSRDARAQLEAAIVDHELFVDGHYRLAIVLVRQLRRPHRASSLLQSFGTDESINVEATCATTMRLLYDELPPIFAAAEESDGSPPANLETARERESNDLNFAKIYAQILRERWFGKHICARNVLLLVSTEGVIREAPLALLPYYEHDARRLLIAEAATKGTSHQLPGLFLAYSNALAQIMANNESDNSAQRYDDEILGHSRQCLAQRRHNVTDIILSVVERIAGRIVDWEAAQAERRQHRIPEWAILAFACSALVAVVLVLLDWCVVARYERKLRKKGASGPVAKVRITVFMSKMGKRKPDTK